MPTYPPSTILRGPFFIPLGVCGAVCQKCLKTDHLAAREAEEPPMTASTWITMIVVMTFIWGGFATVLLIAIRKESGKSDG